MFDRTAALIASRRKMEYKQRRLELRLKQQAQKKEEEKGHLREQRDEELSYSSYSEEDDRGNDLQTPRRQDEDSRTTYPIDPMDSGRSFESMDGSTEGSSVCGDAWASRSEVDLRSTATAVRELKQNQNRRPRPVKTIFPPGSPSSRLRQACSSGSIEEMIVALGDGADPEQPRPDDGCRPLHVASLSGNRHVVLALLRDTNVNPNSTTATATNGENRRYTALHYAAMYDRKAVALALLSISAVEIRSSVNKDARASDGATPLHIAVMFGAAAVAHTLIAKGANVDALMEGGSTPLHLACKRTSQAGVFVSMLLEAGANPHIEDTEGWKPIDLARLQDNNQHSLQLLNLLKAPTNHLSSESPLIVIPKVPNKELESSNDSTEWSPSHDSFIFPEIVRYMRAHRLSIHALFQRVFDQKDTGEVTEKNFAAAVKQYIGLNITGAIVHRLRRSWGATARSHRMSYVEFRNACIQVDLACDDSEIQDNTSSQGPEGGDATQAHLDRNEKGDFRKETNGTSSPSSPRLWSNWHEVADPMTGRIMYWNADTMETSWKRPMGLSTFQDITESKSLIASPVTPKPPLIRDSMHRKKGHIEALACAMSSCSESVPQRVMNTTNFRGTPNRVTTPGTAEWQKIPDTFALHETVRSRTPNAKAFDQLSSSPSIIRSMSSASTTSPSRNPFAHSPLTSAPQLRLSQRFEDNELHPPISPKRVEEVDERNSPRPARRIKKEVKSTIATWLCCWSSTWASSLAQATKKSRLSPRKGKRLQHVQPGSSSAQRNRPAISSMDESFGSGANSNRNNEMGIQHDPLMITYKGPGSKQHIQNFLDREGPQNFDVNYTDPIAAAHAQAIPLPRPPLLSLPAVQQRELSKDSARFSATSSPVNESEHEEQKVNSRNVKESKQPKKLVSDDFDDTDFPPVLNPKPQQKQLREWAKRIHAGNYSFADHKKQLFAISNSGSGGELNFN